MAKMIPLVCPKCGAKLEVKEEAKFAYCQYCGTKILIDTDGHEEINIDNSKKTIVESGIGSIVHYIEKKDQEKKEEEEKQRKEAEEESKRQAIKNEERRRKIRQFFKNHKHALPAIIVAAIILICLGAGIAHYNSSKIASEHSEDAKTPVSAYSAEGKNYEDVQKQFELNGFTNITLKPEEDLVTGWLTDPDSIDTVSINGETDFSEGDWYSKDAEVVIRYHSFPISDESESEATEKVAAATETTAESSSAASAEVNAEEPASTASKNSGSDTSVHSDLTGLDYTLAIKQSNLTNYDNYYLFDSRDHLVTDITTSDSGAMTFRYDGTLSTELTIHYDDGAGCTWEYQLYYPDPNDHSKIKLIDDDGFDYDFEKTDLGDAIEVLDQMSDSDNYY